MKKSTRAKSSKDMKKDGAKKIKKKTSILVQERVDYIDYKDVNLLQRFMSDRSKIRARRVSGNDSQQQRDVATAIKNAREMALLPYAKRVTTQRGSGRERGDRGDRMPRDLTATVEAREEEVLVVNDVDAAAAGNGAGAAELNGEEG